VQKEKKDDYVLLEEVAKEVEEDGKDTMQESTPLLSCALLEKVLVDRLSMDQQSMERQIKGKDKTDEQGNYLEYLVSCFRIGTLRSVPVSILSIALTFSFIFSFFFVTAQPTMTPSAASTRATSNGRRCLRASSTWSFPTLASSSCTPTPGHRP
jgi:hypothetical protein